MKQYYKMARPDGFDFHTGNTINYRDSIGKTVTPKNKDPSPEICTDSVLHASSDVLDALSYARIPCSIYKVSGKPVITQSDKAAFTSMKVLGEIPLSQYDKLLGFKYSEAINPFDPRSVKNPKVSDQALEYLKTWDSVRASVWASVWASVSDSVWASVWASVRASVWASVRDSVWASVSDSVWASVSDSVSDSVWASVSDSVSDSEYAYNGTLFPQVKKWQYTEKLKVKGYPFQSSVELTKLGLIPAFYQDRWHLFTGKGRMLWEGTV